MTHKFVTAILLLASTLAHAQAPLKYAPFDAATLARDNFEQVLAPLAKREGKLVVYNTAGNFDPVWKIGLIPQFEARYGIRVDYRNVKQSIANQQLMAVHQAGVAAPVDVYFAGNTDYFELLRNAGVVARLDLAKLLPNLAEVPDEFKRVIFGVDTGGTWPIVHRNQTTLVYDSALLPPAQVPTSFDTLLAWARKNPKRLAITSPTKGGTGSAFLYGAALHFTTDAACRSHLLDHQVVEEEATRWAAGATCLQPLWNYMAELLKVAELTNGNADTLNLINNRQVVIGTSWEDLVQTFVQGHQLPPTVRQALIDKGMVTSGDGLIVPANARHPAAALLFINMAFGREFQLWKLEHHASRSARSDIDPSSSVSAAVSQTMVPEAQIRSRSVPANWRVTRALVKALEDKVLTKL